MNVEDLLEKTIDGVAVYRRHDKGRIEAAIETGGYLMMAKDKLQHGDWLPWLERAGLQPRTAQRWMELADLGADAELVREYGGIRGALSKKREVRKCVRLQLQLDALEMEKAEIERENAKVRAEIYADGKCEACGGPSPNADWHDCERWRQFIAMQAEIRRLEGVLAHWMRKTAELQREEKALRKRIRAHEKAAANTSR